MAYQHLLRGSPEDDATEGTDEAKHDTPWVMRQSQQENLRTWLHIYSAITTTLICLLLFLNLAARPSEQTAHDVTETIESKYGNDFAYQSLDHRYDDLWAGSASVEEILINLPDSHHTGPHAPATISM